MALSMVAFWSAEPLENNCETSSENGGVCSERIAAAIPWARVELSTALAVSSGHFYEGLIIRLMMGMEHEGHAHARKDQVCSFSCKYLRIRRASVNSSTSREWKSPVKRS